MTARFATRLNPVLFAGQGWRSLLLLWVSLILFSVTLPWQNAQWGVSLPPFFWIAISGLLVGLFLSQIGGRALWRHGLGALAGAGIAIGLVATTIPGGGWQERVGQVITRPRFWMEAVQGGWSNNDLLGLILLLAAVSWLLGYLGPWCVLVWRKPSLLVLAGGVFILEGLKDVPQSASPFILYLWPSLMLMMQLNLAPRDNPSGLRLMHHLSILAMAGLLVLVIWHVPLPQGLLKGGDLWTKVPPWREYVYRVERLFPVLVADRKPVQGDKVLTFGTTLPFGGAIHRTGNVMFEVEGPPGQPEGLRYWRGNVYDVYTSEAWLSGERVSATRASPEPGKEEGFQSRQEITQIIKLLVPGDLFFAAGQPLRASLPAKAESPAPPIYTVPLTAEPEADEELPAEVKEVAAQLRQAALSGDLSGSRISRSLPSGFKLVGMEREGSHIVAVKVQRESPPAFDISALRSPYFLQPSREYSVTSSVSLASPRELVGSSASLPEWVRERYLALPSTLPERVHRLAASLSRDQKSAYGKAIAVQNFVRQLTYRQDIAPPPLDMDAVDYFLFVSQAGYSEYFASAMVVLLRSAGVPARLAVGFASDEYDEEKGVYLARDTHAHAWVEVFFPEYGWVVFEPTPSRPSLAPEGSPPLEAVFGGAGLRREIEGNIFYDDEGLPYILPLGSQFATSYPPPPGAQLGTLLPFPPGSLPVTPRPPPTEPGAHVTTSPPSGTGPGAQPATPRPFPTVPVGVVLLLFLALSTYLFWWRGWSAEGDEGELYKKMCRLATWGRARPQPWLTPLEYGNRLSAALPSQGNAIHLIVDTYGQWLYGKRGGSREARQQVRGAWLSLRRALLKRIFRPW